MPLIPTDFTGTWTGGSELPFFALLHSAIEVLTCSRGTTTRHGG